jgi:L-gulono-1,4-lactone dehydrogenase
MLARIVRTWAINIANSTVFVMSGGKKVLHEGRFRRGTWIDWSRQFRCQPRQYAQPAGEEEVCRLVARAEKVRVVGAGHSFNAAPLSDDLLLSLDQLDQVTVRDDPSRPGEKIASVGAGVGLRDLNHALYDHGVSLPIGGSTNPQSIGGLIATDLHGTGRDHGFLSESLLALRIVDAAGNLATFRPGDDVFHAAIGGAGTCGVVVGAELRCVPAYNLSKTVKVVPRRWAEANLDTLLEENTHLSFYYFGGLVRSAEQEKRGGLTPVRMNKWNRTIDPADRLGGVIKVTDELFDMIFSGHLMGLARVLHVTDWLARFSTRAYALVVNHRAVVYPGKEGFARRLFFRHDEIEYGVPRDAVLPCLEEILALLRGRRYPTIVEVRFTPDHSQGLLGPGVGRPTAHIELAPSMSRPTDAIFREFEAIVLRHGGQPHLGKKVYLDRHQMANIYGPERMERFRAARRAQDPSGKFLNPFTERLLGDPVTS